MRSWNPRGWLRNGHSLAWWVLLSVSAVGASEPAATGIDVSHHSGAVDWSLVKAAGHRFAYAKATEGVDLLDPRFEDHWRGMKEAGLHRGAYHFYVTEDDPLTQASFFLNTVHFEAGDLIPVVDIEVLGHGTQPGLVERLLKFLQAVENEIGVRPVLYTSVNFANAELGDHFANYPLWLAEYDVETPTLPEGWSSWVLWQWAENHPVEGVEKGADVSRLGPTLSSLTSLQIPDLDRSEPAGSEY